MHLPSRGFSFAHLGSSISADRKVVVSSVVLSARSVTRLGSSATVLINSSLGSCLSVAAFMSLGRSLSVSEAGRVGSSLFGTCFTVLYDSVSTGTSVSLGSSLSSKSFARLESRFFAQCNWKYSSWQDSLSYRLGSTG